MISIDQRVYQSTKGFNVSTQTSSPVRRGFTLVCFLFPLLFFALLCSRCAMVTGDEWFNHSNREEGECPPPHSIQTVESGRVCRIIIGAPNRFNSLHPTTSYLLCNTRAVGDFVINYSRPSELARDFLFQLNFYRHDWNLISKICHFDLCGLLLLMGRFSNPNGKSWM